MIKNALLIAVVFAAGVWPAFAGDAAIADSALKDLPAVLRLRYELSWNGVAAGEARDIIRVGGGKYRIESRATPSNLARLFGVDESLRVSEGELDPRLGLRAKRYFEKRGGRAARNARFDWERRLVYLWRGEDQEVAAPLADAGFDRLSFLYHFYLLAAAAAPAAAEAPRGGEYQISDGRRVKTYRYESRPPETLQTAQGEASALILARAGDGKLGVLWLDHARRFPLRLRIGAAGGEMDLRLIAADFAPAE